MSFLLFEVGSSQKVFTFHLNKYGRSNVGESESEAAKVSTFGSLSNGGFNRRIMKQELKNRIRFPNGYDE